MHPNKIKSTVCLNFPENENIKLTNKIITLRELQPSTILETHFSL